MKIITLPFAGGNKYSYSFFKRGMPDSEIINLEYPGRGVRNKEPFLEDIDEIVTDIFNILVKIVTDEPYIIYGHSMGALVGYLLCLRIKEYNIKQPQRLVISGRKAPSVKGGNKLFHLPDDLFWQEVIKIGGIPGELHHHADLINFYIPIIKSDFKIIENYNYEKTHKLNIPIDVFYGNEEEISDHDVMSWTEETTGLVSIKQLIGNHFFIYNHERFFIDYFISLNKNLIYQQTNA